VNFSVGSFVILTQRKCIHGILEFGTDYFSQLISLEVCLLTLYIRLYITPQPTMCFIGFLAFYLFLGLLVGELEIPEEIIND